MRPHLRYLDLMRCILPPCRLLPWLYAVPLDSAANSACANASCLGFASAGILGLRLTLEYSSLYGLRRLGREYMAIREEILWVVHFPNTFWSKAVLRLITSSY